ncbi:syncoilin-like [Genypterus blacodes]|uniref:syncoilin-like n=1 Tax=Genypterus blacodes TaxID=154954 RepID=UPI003F771B74
MYDFLAVCIEATWVPEDPATSSPPPPPSLKTPQPFRQDHGELDMASAQDSHMEYTHHEDLDDPDRSHTDSESEVTTSESTNDTLWKFTQQPVGQVDMDSLGQRLDQCIQQVTCLEMERDDLIEEFLRLQQPMMRVVELFRGKLAEAFGLLTVVQIDKAAVYDEFQQVKRRLFTTARGCIKSQVKLAAQQYEVAQFAVTQEELKAHIQSLTEELSQLQEVHKNQLNSIRAQFSKPCRPRAASDASHCRRSSLSLQRRLSGSVKALEGWYEPRLVGLLRRRQAGEDALRKGREQGNDLRASLWPLRENVQTLQVQKACLEERMTLMEREREESSTQHKETLEDLKETKRELQLEFAIQRRSKKDLEDLKDGLLQELKTLRGCDESTEEEDL